jgi:hypothetical protein
MRSLLLIGALLLSACASKPTGNEYGGVVMQGQTSADKAFRQAQEHCQQYGKSAKLTNREVHNESGDPVLFECLRANASLDQRERSER